MDNDLKRHYMEQYLTEQQQQSSIPKKQSQQQNNEIVVYNKPSTDNMSMEDFKNNVKRWFELDNYIKKAQNIIKEKRQEKNAISTVIMEFMSKYNIEDLNTKEGRIRCKSIYVKEPVNKELVAKRLSDYVHDSTKKEEIINKIYHEREKIEKTTLRRLKIS